MPQDIRSILDHARREDGAGNHPAALMKYRLYLKYEPGDAQAWADYAGCLLAAGRFEDSLRACGAALGIDPCLEPALINRAAALVGLERFGEAREAYEGMLESSPDRTEIIVGLQKCLYRMGDIASMEPKLLKVLDAHPGHEEALSLLIAVHAVGNNWEKYREYSEKYLEAKFEGEELLWERAAMLLKLGDFGEGLRLFENRPSRKKDYGFAGPLWRGGPFPGRTLLVHWEQGFGDTIMMLRYGPMLKTLGGRVALHVQPELLDLARTCAGFDAIVSGPPSGIGPICDLRIPIMSLPLALGTEPGSIPAGVPYLGVPPLVKNRAAILERIRGAGAGRRIGLVWAGNKNYKNDHMRSVPPDHLAPLGECRGAAWFGLQREMPDLRPFEGVTPMGDLMETFADTAFLIDSMDLVVTVDTSVAHLAGALGKPTRLMLPFRCDWRWMEDRSDSPWYPTMRLHRQKYGDVWRDVAADVAKEIAAEMGGAPVT
jgi:tetratricopeptide (TPR) repeat protein